MHPVLEVLLQLQTVEQGRIRLMQQLAKLPAEVAAAEAALAATDKRVASSTALLALEEKKRRQFDDEIGAHRRKADKFRTQLDNITTQAQAAAMEHEILFSSAEADRLENEAFQSLEVSEAEEALLAAACEQKTECAANLATIRVSVERRRGEFLVEIDAAKARLAALRPQVEPTQLARFDRLMTTRGSAVAGAEREQCNGCRMGIRLMLWNQLRAGEMLNCENCGRLLYHVPPTAAQS